jgi:hypothetical protein
MLSLRNAANAQTDDRFFDDQECCIRGLRWPKEANDPDRPAHQGRNGSPTSQREGRHQDPEVFTQHKFIAMKSCDTMILSLYVIHVQLLLPQAAHVQRFIVILDIPHWPLPAVRDLARDGRWSTYDVSVLKLSYVSFRENAHSKQNSPGWVIFSS